MVESIRFDINLTIQKGLEVFMPRPIRKLSKTGYTHVMVRGLTRQVIFNDANDMTQMLRLLFRFAINYDITIVCYCLMINHAHFLINDPEQNISEFMKTFCGTYSQYYNKKYDRCGTLFQRPFKSKPIEDERYLSSVYRYILNNTVKDGICSAQAYKWNSYKLAGKKTEAFDDSIVMDMIGGRNNLDFYLSSEDEEGYSFDADTDFVKISDRSGVREIQDRYNIKTTTIIRMFTKEKREEAVRWLKFKGYSIRQIERLTGIGRGEVERIR